MRLILTMAAVLITAAPMTALAKGFHVDDMADSDGQFGGCLTTLYRDNAGRHPIFSEDGTNGYIRVDGNFITLALASSTDSDKGGVRIFTSANKQLIVRETFLMGAWHPELDSVDLTGTLDVTYKNVKQSFVVHGGTAC